jgi:hypothetical protein
MGADWQSIPLLLGGASNDAERRSTPEIFERNINVKVIRRGDDRVQVLASFLDLEHSFDAEMLVHVPSGRIEHAKAHMAKRPFQTLCLRALDNIDRLEGEIIGRGIYRRITDLIGKSTGCVHLAEIFQAAVGFTATILIALRSKVTEDRRLSEQENRDRMLPVLQNTCQVFRVEEPAEPRKG